MTTVIMNMIDCFLPQGTEQETQRNIEILKGETIVNSVNILTTAVTASATIRDIAAKATAP